MTSAFLKKLEKPRKNPENPADLLRNVIAFNEYGTDNGTFKHRYLVMVFVWGKPLFQ